MPTPDIATGNGADNSHASVDPSAVLQALSSNPRLLAAASALVERVGLARKWGLSFDGLRDLQQALGYFKDRELTTELYKSFYERGDIAERLIEAFPLATWGDGVDIVEDPDPGIETEFEKAWIELSDRLELWSIVIQADIMAGLGAKGYSVIFIGAEGESEVELTKYTKPVPDSVLYLKPLYDIEAKIDKYNVNTKSPRFGLPEVYEIDLGMPDGQSAPAGYISKRKVHWSRIIHIAEGGLGNKVIGKPRLKSVINRLQDKEKLVGGGSEAAWNRMDPGQQWAIDKDYAASLTPEDEQNLVDTFEDVTHGLKRKFRTVGVDIKELASSVSNFGSNVDITVKLMGGGKGIPWRQLIGSELGELATSQDRQNWQDKVAFRRKWFAIPTVIRQIADRFINYGILPKPVSYEAIWPDTEELDEKEKAEVASLQAKANKDQFDAAGQVLLTSDEIRLQTYNLGPLSEVQDNTDNSDKDTTVDTEQQLQAALKANSDSQSRRIVIVGGPRRGKSTIARQLRDSNIPTYCTDPQSLVKDVEENVTYLPEGLSWSDSSQWVADNWLTKPGPWCVEGIAAVRALRKLVSKPDYFDVNVTGIEVIVLESAHPDAEVSSKQESTAKAVMTMWSEIQHHFPKASKIKRDGDSVGSGNSKSVVASVNASEEVPRKYRYSRGEHGRKQTRFLVSVHR